MILPKKKCIIQLPNMIQLAPTIHTRTVTPEYTT